MRGMGKGERKRVHRKGSWMGDSARQILRGRGVKGVKAAGVSEEPESRLCCARVAEEVGEREGFESERGKEGCARSGVERAVEEEMFSGFWLPAASAKEPFGIEMRLVCAEIASAGAKSSEERRLAARERGVETGESETGRRSGDCAKLGAGRGQRPERRPGGLLRSHTWWMSTRCGCNPVPELIVAS